MLETCKNNSIKNEIARIEEKCTTIDDQRENVNAFLQQLSERGYEDTKRHSAPAGHRDRSKQPTPKQHCYFEFPYVNEAVHQAVKRVFRTAQLPVRIYCRNSNLRSLLRRKNNNVQCSMPGCSVQSALCEKKNCVYSMRCAACQSEYIGSTKRVLHKRIKEHLNSPGSSVYRHRAMCKSDFEISIVTTDSITNRLRIKEAITIRERNPTINSKSESDELLHLIF